MARKIKNICSSCGWTGPYGHRLARKSNKLTTRLAAAEFLPAEIESEWVVSLER